MEIEYFDAEGVPVTWEDLPDGGLRVSACDVPGGRWFSFSSVLRNGDPISKGEFEKLVQAELAELPDRPQLLELARRNPASQAFE